MFRLLGLRDPQEIEHTLRPRAQLMLARIILGNGRIDSRVRMRSFLWPEQSAASASVNLRQLLSYLRQWETRNGITLLRSSSEILYRDETCEQTDLDVFKELAVESKRSNLDDLVESYGGELLEGYHAGEPEIDHWLDLERQRLGRAFGQSALRGYREGGSTNVIALLRARELLPLDEALVRAVMRHHARFGNSPQAIAHFANFRSHLRSELGVEPEEETRLLAISMERPRQRLPALPIAREQEGVTPVNDALPTVLILPPLFDGIHVGAVTARIAEAFVNDVTLTLCRTKQFRVYAPQTAQAVSNEKELTIKVDYRATARLLPSRHREGQLRFAFALYHDPSSRILLANDFDFAKENLAWAHAQLSLTLARAVCDGIADFELQNYRQTGGANAYVHFLLGADALNPHSLKSIRRASRSLRASLAIKPDYSPAISMMSRAKTFEWMQLGQEDRGHLAEAQRLAERAVNLDGMDARGHRELGHVAIYHHDLDMALSHYEASARLAPHHADLLADQADVFAHASKWQEARQQIELAIELNPHAPDDYLWVQGAIAFFTRRYEEGLASLKGMKQQDLAVRLMAACAVKLGDNHEARYHMQRSMERDPTFTVSSWSALFPQRDPADTEHYLSALRLAGFPL